MSKLARRAEHDRRMATDAAYRRQQEAAADAAAARNKEALRRLRRADELGCKPEDVPKLEAAERAVAGAAAAHQACPDDETDYRLWLAQDELRLLRKLCTPHTQNTSPSEHDEDHPFHWIGR